LITDQKKRKIKFSCPQDYLETNVSDKVVRLILGKNQIIKKKKYYIDTN
jgi:hypothetical protein